MIGIASDGSSLSPADAAVDASRLGPTPEGRKDVMPRHFGILIPSTNTTCEIEFCHLPSELQVHTGRLGKGGNTPFSPSIDADVAYQAKLLGEARVRAARSSPTGNGDARSRHRFSAGCTRAGQGACPGPSRF